MSQIQNFDFVTKKTFRIFRNEILASIAMNFDKTYSFSAELCSIEEKPSNPLVFECDLQVVILIKPGASLK